MKAFFRNTTVRRILSLALLVFALAFAFTFKGGYCLGDEILRFLHLRPWSDGVYGTHYAIFYAAGIAAVGILCYPKKKQG